MRLNFLTLSSVALAGVVINRDSAERQVKKQSAPYAGSCTFYVSHGENFLGFTTATATYSSQCSSAMTAGPYVTQNCVDDSLLFFNVGTSCDEPETYTTCTTTTVKKASRIACTTPTFAANPAYIANAQTTSSTPGSSVKTSNLTSAVPALPFATSTFAKISGSGGVPTVSVSASVVVPQNASSISPRSSSKASISKSSVSKSSASKSSASKTSSLQASATKSVASKSSASKSSSSKASASKSSNSKSSSTRSLSSKASPSGNGRTGPGIQLSAQSTTTSPIPATPSSLNVTGSRSTSVQSGGTPAASPHVSPNSLTNSTRVTGLPSSSIIGVPSSAQASPSKVLSSISNFITSALPSANLPSNVSSIISSISSLTSSAAQSTATCYADNINRHRTFSAASTTSPNMTNALCRSFCSNFAYSGTEFSSECYCSNTKPFVPSTECTMSCSGAANETCGGPDALSITYHPIIAAQNALASTYTSHGCYKDNYPVSRVLNESSTTSSALTVESCIGFCSRVGYSIAGVENGLECFCGTTLLTDNSTFGISDPSACTYVCSGNSDETCGGPNHLDIYSLSPILLTSDPRANEVPFTAANANGQCASDYIAAHNNTRTLSGASTRIADMTIQQCQVFCKDYQYYGVEYSTECYCGNSIGAGAVVTNNCTNICPGNDHQVCGGGWAMNIYAKSLLQ